METNLCPTDSYEIIAWANDQEVIYYQTFGFYQGEWLMVAIDDEKVYLYKDWFGSCSVCDPLEGTFFGVATTKEEAKKFAEDFPPFLEVGRDEIKLIAESCDLQSIMPANVDLCEFTWDDVIDDIVKALSENL